MDLTVLNLLLFLYLSEFLLQTGWLDYGAQAARMLLAAQLNLRWRNDLQGYLSCLRDRLKGSQR